MNSHKPNNKKKSYNILNTILGIWPYIYPKRKLLFIPILTLVLLCSVLEVVGIGLLLPFVGILINPEQVLNSNLITPFIKFLNISNKNELILIMTISFILIVLITTFLRVFLIWSNTKFSFLISGDLSHYTFNKILYLDYIDLQKIKSSDVIVNVTNRTNLLNRMIASTLQIISNAIIFIFILMTLIFVQPEMTLLILLSLFIIYLLLFSFMKIKLNQYGEEMNFQMPVMIRVLQEGLGGIKDIILDTSQKFFSEEFKSHDLKWRNASSNSTILMQAPRYIIEGLAVVVICFVFYYLSLLGKDLQSYLPVIAAFIYGVQKLLPTFQNIYNGWAGLKTTVAPVQDLSKLLESLPKEERNFVKSKKVKFSNNIKIKNLNFGYQDGPSPVLRNINLTILKGSKVGFFGESGGGKTSLINIIMGLLKPTSGSIWVDDTKLDENNIISWRKKISHIPQNIFLADKTIEENIAFGISTEMINKNKVNLSAKSANINKKINSMEQKYKTVIGERGFKLSGGQAQRIGIARAIYKDREIFVLDEATSALDEEIERDIIKDLKNLKNKTFIFIAHRLNTLKICDQVVEIQKGKIKKIYNKKEFREFLNIRLK